MIISKKYLESQKLSLEPNTYIIDIETTGFSPKFASIYMIGLVSCQEKQCITEQWMAEKDSDEYEMLFKLNQLLTDNPTLYHYNGDQFDMPFIKKRMAIYNITCEAYESKDILKIVRPFKKRLALENMKLKTIEAYFGYHRDDPFSGGDLIEVYHAYLAEHDEQLKETLLLHNYEDLLGLMDVMAEQPLFQLMKDFRNGNFEPSLHTSTIENGIYEGKFNVPLTDSYQVVHPMYDIEISSGEVSLRLPVKVDTLYHFFPDPKNYYYLVSEGYAIHKSVGQFVAKDHRIQASKATAYVKKEGFYLPANKRYELPVPLYFADTEQKECYVSVEDLVETNSFELYIKALLMQM